jgi:thiosulfate/3-mercaptopyruvate sulfurtransferase
MKMRLTAWGAAIALALAGGMGVRAASPRDTMLVSAAWLAQHAKDANLVLLHVGDKAEYDAAHIAGARLVATRDLAVPPQGTQGLTLEMPPPDVLASKLEALGISDNSHVVVYYGKDWVSPATRIVFTLVYAGLPAVSLLDGGMGAWTKAGQPVTADVPPPATGHLSPLKPKPLIVDAEFVKSHAGAAGFSVVDSRDAAFYNGTQPGGPVDHRKAGHIPGARSVPFTQITNEDLTLKSPAELAAIFEKAGVGPNDTVVTYCHIGQQATATLFGALTLGHPVMLYDGSFEDWARRDLPVENPAKDK